jgi:hypothetical protein
MKKDLKSKWAQDDKVGGLQIAIQACKLLHDTSNAVNRLSKSEISCSKVCLCDGNCLAIWYFSLLKN